MNNLEIKVIRFDESNKNQEALKGQYAQIGHKCAVFTIIKNILFINLLPGANYNNLKLPEIYDGFLNLSDGTILEVKNSTLTCNIPNNVNAQGTFVLKKWN